MTVAKPSCSQPAAHWSKRARRSRFLCYAMAAPTGRLMRCAALVRHASRRSNCQRRLGMDMSTAIVLSKWPIGEAILWLGDDDLLMPDHLERIGELWDTGGFDLVQSNGVAVAPDDTLEWFAPDWSLPVNRVRLARGNTNPMSSVSLRVDLASAIGGWNAELPRAADWDLWQRALAAGARSARSPEPTVLHFHASDRDQAWPLRVRQNEAWLDRLGDPDRLSELRIALRLVEAERASRIEQYAAEVEQYANDLRHTLDAARLETLEVREHAARIDAQRAGAEATLARIYTGGWWRLRSKLLPLLKRLGHEG